MTPSEKKAREIQRTLDLYYTETDEDVMKGNKASRVNAIAIALDAAERRGFERARNLAINWFAKNGYEALKMEFENLKYEASHDEA